MLIPGSYLMGEKEKKTKRKGGDGITFLFLFLFLGETGRGPFKGKGNIYHLFRTSLGEKVHSVKAVVIFRNK